MKYLLIVNSQYLRKLGSERTTANPLEAETFRDRKSALLAADAYQTQYSTERSSVVPLDRALARYISRVRLPGRGVTTFDLVFGGRTPEQVLEDIELSGQSADEYIALAVKSTSSKAEQWSFFQECCRIIGVL